MPAAEYLIHENFWTDKAKYDDAERQYYERLTKASLTPLAVEVARARQRLIEVTESVPVSCPAAKNKGSGGLESRLDTLEKTKIEQLESRLSAIELTPQTAPVGKKEAPKAQVKAEDDDDVDLFGSESEDENEAAAKVREERLAAYNAKKSKKPALIAKSNVILDVKPWDDETDMAAMEREVRKIETDGLLWGAAKLVPLAYGIRKLQISCVVEDDKVSIDWLQEQIEALEDHVQSVDIAAFNKI